MSPRIWTCLTPERQIDFLIAQNLKGMPQEYFFRATILVHRPVKKLLSEELFTLHAGNLAHIQMPTVKKAPPSFLRYARPQTPKKNLISITREAVTYWIRRIRLGAVPMPLPERHGARPYENCGIRLGTVPQSLPKRFPCRSRSGSATSPRAVFQANHPAQIIGALGIIPLIMYRKNTPHKGWIH